MINLRNYSLNDSDKEEIKCILLQVGSNPSLEQIWASMDKAWVKHGCNSRRYDEEKYSAFYSDSVWLLNGIFIEQHLESMGHRQAIAKIIQKAGCKHILDFGGGFGTLARLIAEQVPDASIDIFEPYPPRHGIESCKKYPSISFVSNLASGSYDALVCTDVLEHVHDPLELLAKMVKSVRQDGILVIANCFYPVIACHLPSTFHFRDSFNQFCEQLGLKVIGPSPAGHGVIYCREIIRNPDWKYLRRLERQSRRNYLVQELMKPLQPIESRIKLAIQKPGHYPRKLVDWASRGKS